MQLNLEDKILYCRRTYVVWQSSEKVVAESAEKAVFEKKLDKILWSFLCYNILQRGRP